MWFLLVPYLFRNWFLHCMKKRLVEDERKDKTQKVHTCQIPKSTSHRLIHCCGNKRILHLTSSLVIVVMQASLKCQVLASFSNIYSSCLKVFPFFQCHTVDKVVLMHKWFWIKYVAIGAIPYTLLPYCLIITGTVLCLMRQILWFCRIRHL